MPIRPNRCAPAMTGLVQLLSLPIAECLPCMSRCSPEQDQLRGWLPQVMLVSVDVPADALA